MTMQWKAENVLRYFDITMVSGGSPTGLITAQIMGKPNFTGLFRRDQLDVNVSGAKLQTDGTWAVMTVELPLLGVHAGLLNRQSLYAFNLEATTSDIAGPVPEVEGDKFTVQILKARIIGPLVDMPDNTETITPINVMFEIRSADLLVGGSAIAGYKFDKETGLNVRPVPPAS